MTKTFLIGERQKYLSRVQWDVLWKEYPHAYIECLRKYEALQDVRDRCKYFDLGVCWHECMNLLPPAQQGEQWQYQLAKNTAEFAFDRLHDDYDLVYIMGRRVAEAFGLKKVPFFVPCDARSFRKFYVDTIGLTTFVVIPNPNGQFWRDDIEMEVAMQELAKIKDRLKVFANI